MKLNICTDKYTTEGHVNETRRWIFQDIADIENTINALFIIGGNDVESAIV